MIRTLAFWSDAVLVVDFKRQPTALPSPGCQRVIKYIGSKRTLIPVILNAVRSVSGVRSVIDLFSGTSRVGHALKQSGYQVFANDHNSYAATLARCYVEADAESVLDEVRELVKELNGLRGSPGYFTETFCIKSRFFQPRNGERIDAIREEIAAKGLRPELEAVMLVSLMEAADRVDSTTGLQMAYLKSWAPRAHNALELRVPQVLPQAKNGKGSATCLEALEAARSLTADVAYLDPPYNQHSYLGNYHAWESLVRWDKPEVYGIACKRVDVRQRQSIFNSRPRFARAFREVLDSLTSRVVIVSFNDEGYLSREDLEAMLSSLWDGAARVLTIENDFKRYVGAQIGIHNLQGEKVGKVSHLRNKEYVYVAAHPDADLRESSLASGVPGQISLFGAELGSA